MKVTYALRILIVMCSISCTRESDDTHNNSQQKLTDETALDVALQDVNVSDDTRIYGSVFQHLIGIKDGDVQRGVVNGFSAYYLRVDDLSDGWKDPNSIIIKHLQKFSKPVLEFSKCRKSTDGIWDQKNGKRGILISIDRVVWDSNEKVIVLASIQSQSLAAGMYRYSLVKTGAKWIITNVALTCVS